MKKNLLFLVFAFLLISCDDGDIIVTDFDFDEINLDLCPTAGTNNFVYFKINNETNEGISFNFTQTSFSEESVGEFELPLNAPNQLTYRRFNTSINPDYYCGTIPPSNITVSEEFISSGGTAKITTNITDEDDNDGIDAKDEDLNGNGNLDDDDTDGDGIPNYKDQDDDNDNVLTVDELTEKTDTMEAGAFIDTDKDGIFDHLDMDDDGDDIATRLEDINGNGDPTDDRLNSTSVPFYLDATANTPVNAENMAKIKDKPNSVKTEYTTTILFIDLVLNGLDQRIIDENLTLLGTRIQEKTESTPEK